MRGGHFLVIQGTEKVGKEIGRFTELLAEKPSHFRQKCCNVMYIPKDHSGC